MLPRLLLLVGIVFFTMLGGSAIYVISHVETIDTASDGLLARLATAGSTAVESELARIIGGLELLAAAPQLDPGRQDPEDLDQLVRRTAATLGMPIAATDRTLGQIADSSLPFGTPLPPAPATNAAYQALETHRPALGEPELREGARTVPVFVPVLRANQAIGVLVASVDLRRLERRVLATAGAGGGIMVLDRHGQPLLGGGPADAVIDPRLLFAVPEGTAFDAALHPPEVLRIVARRVAEPSGWIVTAQLPRSSLSAVYAVAARPAVVAGAVAFFLGLAGAVLLTGRLRRPIEALTEHARAVAEAGDAPLPDPPLALATAEFEALRVQMLNATAALSAREKRHRALAETGALVTWRADAGGALTEAAGWAALTGQTEEDARGDGWLGMVHPDDRAPALAAWGRCLVARAPINVEYRLRSLEEPKAWRWVRTTGVPVLDGQGRVTEWYGTIRDVGDRRGAIEARAANEAQVRQTLAELRAVYDSVPVGLALVDKDMKFLNINARVAAISGLPTGAHIGRTAREVLPPGLAEPVESAQRLVLETGRPVLDVSCSGDTPGAVRNIRHWLASCHPVFNADGQITGVSSVLHDVTDRVRAEHSRELLLRELNHRVKNTLATVQSIAAQTLRGAAGDPRRFGQDFVARLQALARAHDLLTAHAWEDADFAEVVPAALAPWMGEGRRVATEGPNGLMLRPAQAQAVMLALHELATNAAKHGALSRPEGQVRATWTATPEGTVLFEWVESGGPTVTVPTPERRGFGTRLLERALAQDLGQDANVTLRFELRGLRAQIRFRATVTTAPAAAAQ
ncbi:MAG TPA: PAS domain-containing protein [Acetobacteraceae bacterium]|nr:PAS domain-containing protein [Acetobacteraceae bacterium]